MKKEAQMETHELGAADVVGGGKAARVLRYAGVAAVVILSASNLLRGRWVMAAFFLAVAFFFLTGKKMDGWPKPVRVILLVVYVALSAAAFVLLIQELKARG